MKTRTKLTLQAFPTAALTGFFSLAFLTSAVASDFSGSLKGVTITDAQKNNTPPVAAFTHTISGDTVSFDASGSYDPDGSIGEYKWDFGDGNGAIGANASHKYTEIGTFQVTVTVVDNANGVALAQQKIQLTGGASMYWSMDGLPTESMLSDAGNITITKYMNAADSVPGVKGNAMAQTGTHQAYTIPMSAVPTDKGTIELYARHDFGPDASNRFFFQSANIGSANTIYAYVYKTYVFFYLYDAAGTMHRVYSTPSFDSKSWYKYEFVWNRASGYLGIKRDGNVLVEKTFTPWTTPSWGAGQNFFIGNVQPVGSFDEFRILNN